MPTALTSDGVAPGVGMDGGADPCAIAARCRTRAARHAGSAIGGVCRTDYGFISMLSLAR